MKLAWFVLISLIGLLPVLAADGPPDNPLTLQRAIALMLSHHPQLKTAEYDTLAAAARIEQAATTPPYRATINMENMAGTGEARGA